MKIPCALVLLAAFAAAGAQQADPLKSDACGAALSQLQAARSAGAPPQRVEALRSEAAGTCLGSRMEPTRPSRVARPPIVVPPPVIEVPGQAALPAAPSPPPPPVAIDRGPAPALCDANGCWINDGTHLRQVQPALPGPRGPCSAVGALVYCP
jgi:hypothetical protein